MIKSVIAFAGAIVIAALAAAPAAAQYPSKPIRIVLQFPAGGATDAAARILGQALTQAMGQPVLVENRPGADGAIAAEVVAKAAPDGYTVFLASNTPMMQVPLLRKNPPYDPVTDFTPITSVGRYIFILVVHPSVPAKSVAELVAHARTNPGKLNFGSFSSVGQLMFAQMRTSTNTEMVLVPYKGEAPAMKGKGRMLARAITVLSIECLPEKVPPQIEVDISILKELVFEKLVSQKLDFILMEKN